MRVCGSGDVRPRRLPCRSDKAVYWQAAPPLGHATTFAAARWRRAHRGPRRGTSSCRYRCRSRRSRYWLSETWRAPCLWRPLPASLAGGAGARPDHPISRRRREVATKQKSPGRRRGLSLLEIRGKSVTGDDRAAKTIVDAGSDEIDVLSDAVCPRGEGDSGSRGKADVTVAHKQVIIFNCERPIRSERVFATDSNNATPAGFGCPIDIGVENGRIDDEAIILVVGNGGATLHVKQERVPGITDLTGEETDCIDL